MVGRRKQPKIASKRRKFQNRTGDEAKDDRISALPSCVLLEILSRLPSTKDAIRTGALSNRWKNLWTSVPTLIFKGRVRNVCESDFVSFVDKTLIQCRQSKLTKLEVESYDIRRFASQVNNWIRYAISCNVEVLKLELWKPVHEAGYPLDELFFRASSFTHLRLEGCIFNPTGAISWKNLRSLSISYGNLDEDLIENILSGSPVLETLVLDYCEDYRRLNITSKSLKNLVLSGYIDYLAPPNDGSIEINAPHISSLRIRGCLLLWKPLLVNVSSLVEANLDYTLYDHHETSTLDEAEEEMLKVLMLNLCRVKELKFNFGDECSKTFSRLKDKGFTIPSNAKFH
ncbi:unnamed protein product [Lactuca saligna]|uniref:F-box domain-containing protein n=1 Tax=Lactuca saligna TaxID=75948 RepID=A0AA35ZIL9_LACSI|nr:unnamed protein product [Lactuca saligna]